VSMEAAQPRGRCCRGDALVTAALQPTHSDCSATLATLTALSRRCLDSAISHSYTTANAALGQRTAAAPTAASWPLPHRDGYRVVTAVTL
jgi:hypothetical protein